MLLSVLSRDEGGDETATRAEEGEKRKRAPRTRCGTRQGSDEVHESRGGLWHPHTGSCSPSVRPPDLLAEKAELTLGSRCS